jgi:Na+-transporting methylmalonyl-CoA/oxaloacetate decarboxylase gamma subunit
MSGLIITAVGIVLTFLVLGVLVLVVMILGKVGRYLSFRETEKARGVRKRQPPGGEDSGKTIAIISAVMAAYLRKLPSQIRVSSIRQKS